MKAEIEKEGFIRITAETPVEAFAIKHIIENYTKKGEAMRKTDCPVIFDMSILPSGKT